MLFPLYSFEAHISTNDSDWCYGPCITWEETVGTIEDQPIDNVNTTKRK